jgi:acetyl-CoA synthetase
MVLEGSTYEEIYRNFRWNIPEFANIAEMVVDRHANDPSRLALIYEDIDGKEQRFSFADIRDRANRVGNALLGLGIGRGDRVGICLTQRPETAITHIACFKTGILSLPLFTQFGPDALRHRLGDSGARAVVTDRENLPKIEAVMAELPALAHVLVIDGGGTTGAVLDYWALASKASSSLKTLRTRSSDPAIIIYTSGTTGAPKGALHSHAMTLAHEPVIEFTHDFFPKRGDRFWTPADWAWGGGLFDCLLPSWLVGVAVVAHRFRKFDPEQAFSLIARHEVRNAFMPPTALKMMREVERPAQRHDLKMRSIASGGEALGAEILDWGRSTFGLTINEFWGQTEANLLTGNCAVIMPVKPGSMGRATPGHVVEVMSEDGRLLPPGESGVLVTKTPIPIAFIEYWNNEEGTRRKFRGEWLLTGDVGYKDEDGYFWFQGRDDDIISSGAYRIGPTEIEDCIMKHPAVAIVAVIGKPHDVRGEIVKAFVVLKKGIEERPEITGEIQALVKQRLAAYEYPREIEFVAELPMTTTGKVLRRELRALEKSRKAGGAG